MARRMRLFAQVLSYQGMTNACAAGLQPTRRLVRKKGFAFQDKSGEARKDVGPVRKYKTSTQRRYKGGGAYFRAGLKIAVLEARHGHDILQRAQRETYGQTLTRFVRAADREVNKAVAKGRLRF